MGSWAGLERPLNSAESQQFQGSPSPASLAPGNARGPADAPHTCTPRLPPTPCPSRASQPSLGPIPQQRSPPADHRSQGRRSPLGASCLDWGSTTCQPGGPVAGLGPRLEPPCCAGRVPEPQGAVRVTGPSSSGGHLGGTLPLGSGRTPPETGHLPAARALARLDWAVRPERLGSRIPLLPSTAQSGLGWGRVCPQTRVALGHLSQPPTPVSPAATQGTAA